MARDGLLATHLDIFFILGLYIFLFGNNEDALLKLFMNLVALAIGFYSDFSEIFKRLFASITLALFLVYWFDWFPMAYTLLSGLIRVHIVYYLTERRLRTGDVFLICMQLSDGLKANQVIEKQIYASFVPFFLRNIFQTPDSGIFADLTMVLPNIFLLSTLIRDNFQFYLQ